MKLASLILCIFLLILGSLIRNESIQYAGTCLFLFVCMVDIFQAYKEAKLFRAKKWKPPNKTFANKAEHILHTSAFFVGFIMLIAHIHTLCGGLIIVGALLNGLICGTIVRDVGGLPIEWGFYGWQSIRKRKRR